MYMSEKQNSIYKKVNKKNWMCQFSTSQLVSHFNAQISEKNT